MPDSHVRSTYIHVWSPVAILTKTRLSTYDSVVVPSLPRLMLTPFVFGFQICTSLPLSVILDSFSILSSLCLTTSIVSLVPASTTYANSVPSANHYHCTLSRLWSMH